MISGVVAAGGRKDAAKARGFLARAGAALRRERTATQGSFGGSTTLRGLRRERPMVLGHLALVVAAVFRRPSGPGHAATEGDAQARSGCRAAALAACGGRPMF